MTVYVEIETNYGPDTFQVNNFRRISGGTADLLYIVKDYKTQSLQLESTLTHIPYEAVKRLFEHAQQTGKIINLQEAREQYETKTGPFAPEIPPQSRGPG